MSHESLVFAMIRSGASGLESMIPADDIQAKGDFGQTTLQEAIANRKLDLATWLIARGVDLDNRDRSGYTALHYSLELYYYFSMAETLIRAGADVRIPNKDGNAALWSAVRVARGNYALIDLLLAHGADPNQRNKVGKSPLDLAIEIADPNLVERLRPPSEAG